MELAKLVDFNELGFVRRVYSIDEVARNLQ